MVKWMKFDCLLTLSKHSSKQKIEKYMCVFLLQEFLVVVQLRCWWGCQKYLTLYMDHAKQKTHEFRFAQYRLVNFLIGIFLLNSLIMMKEQVFIQWVLLSGSNNINMLLLIQKQCSTIIVKHLRFWSKIK